MHMQPIHHVPRTMYIPGIKIPRKDQGILKVQIQINFQQEVYEEALFVQYLLFYDHATNSSSRTSTIRMASSADFTVLIILPATL